MRASVSTTIGFPSILKRRKILKTLCQGRCRTKREMTPYIYIYIVMRLLLSPLVLIRLSILLVCDTTEIMMNRSLILVIDVASNSCRRIECEELRRAHSRLNRNVYRSITSSGRYFFQEWHYPQCSSRRRLRNLRPRSRLRYPLPADTNAVPTCLDNVYKLFLGES